MTRTLHLAMLLAACSHHSGDGSIDASTTAADASSDASVPSSLPPIVLAVVASSSRIGATPAAWVVPDEHSAFLPLPGVSGTYLVYTGGNLGPDGSGSAAYRGAMVMTTSDFATFADATPAGYASPVMSPHEHELLDCSAGWDNLFDDNYAAPGSVFIDPAAPTTMLMLYEAENHCRGSQGNTGDQDFYVTVGVARSTDQGMTWPAPGSAEVSDLEDAPSRYAGVMTQVPKPVALAPPLGDAIPSGFAYDGNIYAYFIDRLGADGSASQIEVARASDTGADPMTFYKFGSGAWATAATGTPGKGSSLIQFPADNLLCSHANVHEVTGIDSVPSPLFVMTLECDNRNTVTGSAQPQGAWFYATTTDLETQQWSLPAVIANTQAYLGSDGSFAGWYPSFVTPGLSPDQLGSAGHAIYSDGLLVGARKLGVRDFTIAPGTPAAFVPLP